MIEKVALFGEALNLTGIVTQAEAGAGPARDPAFVLLNAGVTHRIGPGRLNVKLARRLAAQGFTALRFDLSGIGDSRTAHSTLSFEAQAVADVRAAMDYLQTTRAIRRFVVAGLCSGADNSYAAALVDRRVVGVVMLDPSAYPTWQTRPRFLLRAAGNPRWLATSVRRQVGKLFGGSKKTGDLGASTPSSERYVRPKPPLADFAAGLAAILGRGGAVMAVYSGSSIRQFSHKRQLDEVLRPFNLADRVDCRFWADANHTFTELSVQDRLADTVADWTVQLPA